jgi:hypothetical protein
MFQERQTEKKEGKDLIIIEKKTRTIYNRFMISFRKVNIMILFLHHPEYSSIGDLKEKYQCSNFLH